MDNMDNSLNELTGRVLSCAFRVHSVLGPGLLEGAYKACLKEELEYAGLRVELEVQIPVKYRNAAVDCAYRADVIVEGRVLVELKSVEALLPIHSAQTITYLKLSGLRAGLLLNFNARHLKDGLRRFNLRDAPSPLTLLSCPTCFQGSEA